ncbi:sigma-70 family RNA polymerase sigma factor [soil metagenome]
MTPRAIIDENNLVSRLKARDTEAFELLYDRYSAAIYGVILKIVSKEDQAEEVMQDVFMKIWNNLASYDATKGRLFTWMINIARNSAIDKIRTKDFRQGSAIQNIDSAVYEVNSIHQHYTATDHIGLKETIGKLKDIYKEVLDYVYFKGYTHEETSEELKIPLGTVKTRIRAAIQQLRELMDV